MDLPELRSFLAVAETLHFSRAADRVGITQPALSQQVRRLEEQLGLTLFHRTSRRVRLTNAGRALVVGARRVLADLEQAERLCRDAAAGEAGQLTVAAIGAPLNS